MPYLPMFTERQHNIFLYAQNGCILWVLKNVVPNPLLFSRHKLYSSVHLICREYNLKDRMQSKNTSGYFSFYVDNISLKTYSTCNNNKVIVIVYNTKKSNNNNKIIVIKVYNSRKSNNSNYSNNGINKSNNYSNKSIIIVI